MISVRLFGGTSLYSDGERLGGAPTQRHRLALLAILAASHPRSISRAQAIGLLWPERSDARARNLLNQALHVLRRALGAERLVSSGEDIHLEPDGLDCDVVRFAEARSAGRLREAVELYEGAFLDGFSLPDAASFGPWLDGERERFRRECADALDTLARAAMAGGAHDEAVHHYRRLTALDPYSTRATVGLMEALEAAGDPAAALRHARVHDLLMRETLDAASAPEVQAIAERLREHAERADAQEPETAGPEHGESTSSTRPRGLDVEARAVPRDSAANGDGRPSRDVRPVAAPGSPDVSGGPAGQRLRLVLAAALLALVSVPIARALLPTPDVPADAPRILVTAPGATGSDDLDRWVAYVVAGALTGMAEVVDVTPSEWPGLPLATVDPAGVSAGEGWGVAPLVIEVRSVADASGVGLRASVRAGPDGTVQAEFARRGDPESLDRVVTRLAEDVRRAVREASAGVRATGHPVFVPDRAAFVEFVRGSDLALNGRSLESIPYYERAASRDPDWPRPVLSLAIWWYNQSELERADSLIRVVESMGAPLVSEERALADLVRSWLGNDPRERRDAARAVARLRPDGLSHVQWVWEELRLNGPDSALAVLATIDSTREVVRGWRAHWQGATIIYHRLGRHRDELEVARQAEAALPGDPVPLFLQARALIALDSLAEAWTLTERMLALPQRANRSLPGTFAVRLGEVVRVFRSEDEAAPFFEAAVQWFREAPPAERSSPFNEGAFLDALLMAEGVESARAALDSLDVGLSEVQRAGYAGVFAALTGDTVRADSTAEWLSTRAPRYRTHEPFVWRARIAVGLGRLDDARDLLNRAEERSGRWYRYDPLLAPLWTHESSPIPGESR